MRSLAVLLGTSLLVLARRALGRPRVAQWSIAFEIGTLFYRHQFNHAFALDDVASARAYFDSLYVVVDPELDVEQRPSADGEPRGDWYVPRNLAGGPTLLYFHGGGYAFYATVTRHFIAMLAQLLKVRIFAPDYRLTPEHPHPAQVEDGVAACRWLLASGVDPRQLIIAGDSAGGHLVLMSLLALREAGLAQPALAIALSPWTDIGERGASQFGNDCYDMVQGYQTLRFGQWLRGASDYSVEALSPIYHDYRGIAPVYLQAGGKEVLVDMIRDFAALLVQQGAAVRLDVWPHMTHQFHAYGDSLAASREAIAGLRRAVSWATGDAAPATFSAGTETEFDSLDVHGTRIPASPRQ